MIISSRPSRVILFDPMASHPHMHPNMQPSPSDMDAAGWTDQDYATYRECSLLLPLLSPGLSGDGFFADRGVNEESIE